METGVSKKFFIAFILLAFLTPLVLLQGQGGFADFALAGNPAQSGLRDTANNLELPNAGNPITLAAQIIKFILGFLGLVFILLLIYGGYLRMTAQGSPEKIKASNGIIISAIVGVFIILASYGITLFVMEHIEKKIMPETVGANACVYTCMPESTCSAGRGTSFGQKNCSKEQICCKLTPSP